jgi:FKBP-type peptidyl-prolyl cis-trans isomerase
MEAVFAERMSVMSVCRLLGFLALLAGFVAAGSGATALGQDKAPPKSEFKTLKEKASYAIGANIGKSFRQQSLDISPELIARGLRDALNGEKVLMTDQEAEEALTQFQEEAVTAMAERQKKEGAAYLALNGKKPDVKTTSSGLQYKVLKTGTGPKPKADDVVTTHYRGTLVNGNEFDSSYKRGEPATFPVTGVIAGWTEALQMMPVGSKWQLTIPANLAYGERGRPPVIAPNSTLLFDIELLAVGPPKTQEQESVLPKVRLKQ